MTDKPFPWLYSLLTKAGILSAGVVCLMAIGWPISESRESLESHAALDSRTQARKHVQKDSSIAGSAYRSLGRQVDLNQGQLEDLERLPGIGAILAQRIVEYRQSHGPFQTVNALRDVPGIGEARITGLRPLVMVTQGN